MSDDLIAAVTQAWADAAAVAPGTRTWRAVRISCSGPLVVLAGIRQMDGARAVLFETAIENAPSVRERFEADGISMIEDRNYTDRTYRIVVTLERADLDNIFRIVIADLVEAAAPHGSASQAVTALFSRLAAWQAFLRARRAGLSSEAVTGLIGELLVLKRLADLAGWPVACASWAGPAGGLHDFFRHGIALEVKTAARAPSLINISSLDQLDSSGLHSLLLAHVHLTESATGRTLPALVDEILHYLIETDPAALRSFKDTLMASGYTPVDADLYQRQQFQMLSIRYFEVTPAFPRLTRASCPQGVVNASYTLDVRAIQPHLLDDKAAENILQRMRDLA